MHMIDLALCLRRMEALGMQTSRRCRAICAQKDRHRTRSPSAPVARTVNEGLPIADDDTTSRKAAWASDDQLNPPQPSIDNPIPICRPQPDANVGIPIPIVFEIDGAFGTHRVRFALRSFDRQQ